MIKKNKTLSLIALTGLLNICNAQEYNFSIKGRLSDPTLEGKALVLYCSGYRDTAVVKNQQFEFPAVKQIGRIKLQELNRIERNYLTEFKEPIVANFYVDGTSTQIKGYNLSAIEVSDNKLQTEYKQLLRGIEEALQLIPNATQLEKWEKSNSLLLDYMEIHPESLVSHGLFMDFFDIDHMKSFRIAHIKRVQKIYQDLLVSQPKNESLTFLAFFLEGDAKVLEIGQMAPNFNLQDAEGKSISLSDYRGKYIYLDFWASWCKGCRMQHPLLRRLHTTYKNAPLEIISVSLDAGAHAREKWLKAIQDDKLSWTQVAELKRPSNVQKAYGFMGVPMNYLIDPEGRIMAHYLHGDYLETYLKTIFSSL